MTRLPPILWLCTVAGSLLIVVDYSGDDLNPGMLALGIVLVLVGAVGSLWMSFGRWGHRPQVRGVAWLIPAAVVFFLLCAIAASVAGGSYAVVAIVVGLIPFTAATLLTATARAKTVGGDDGTRGASPGASDDPFPGIGGDDATPVGDTTEHSDAERVARPDDRFERPGRTRAR
jgi:hypothetical protein